MIDIIKKIFRGKNPKITTAELPIQTTPLSEDQLRAVSQEPLDHKPAQFLMGSGFSVGLQRDHNEDALYTMSTVLVDGASEIPFGICIIADGMGGHKNGEIASSVSARVVAKYLISKVYTQFLELQNEPMDESIQETIEQSIKEAQKSVIRHAPGGGTTLTVALILGEQVTIAHVGDSRAYFIYPDGRIQKVTKDHSLVQRMIDLEELTEAEAAVHPQRNVLLKAVGQNEPYRADVQTHQIPRGGTMMLCSDGLWGVVPDTELYRIISTSEDPVLASHKLVEAANSAGGPDNISAILVHFYGS